MGDQSNKNYFNVACSSQREVDEMAEVSGGQSGGGVVGGEGEILPPV